MKHNLKELQELLIIIDMVNGFVKEGALADPYINHIIPEQERLIKSFLERQQGVLLIKDTHTKDSAEFNTFPVHCLKGTQEAELVDELKKYEKNCMVIEKNSTSAIFAEGFLQLINQMTNLKKVIGCGCEADMCVPNTLIPLKNYFDQKNKKIEIVVPSNAIETFEAPNHPREEYFEVGTKMMSGSGITLVKKYNIKGEN